jgi:hypothetical protein
MIIWLMNNGQERKWLWPILSVIYLEGMRETLKALNQNRRSANQDSNWPPSEYTWEHTWVNLLSLSPSCIAHYCYLFLTMLVVPQYHYTCQNHTALGTGVSTFIHAFSYIHLIPLLIENYISSVRHVEDKY